MSEKSAKSILPRDKAAAPLDVVIAVMAFLAALALGASLIAERAALGWRAGLSDKLTVQVLVPEKGQSNDIRAELDRQTNAALAVLQTASGIAHASILSEKDTMALIEPWIGSDKLIDDLPLPRLIDADVTPGAPVDLAALTAKLKNAAPNAVLDDHSRWIARLKGISDTVIWAAYGILLLIAIATAATVSFATRAGLDAHHEMVALLHQMGARAGFIARAFERHYFVSALGAAAAGTVLAALCFLAAGGLEFAGIEAVPFLPPLSLKIPELPWLLAVPLVVAVIALVTTRLSVLAVLRKIY
jgi:cell division transport system permease protein